MTQETMDLNSEKPEKEMALEEIKAELIERAKQQNLHTMIGVIDSENTNSIDFHKKFGFEEVGFIKESGFKFNRWLHSVFVQKIL